jgi:hypothetical protein
MLIEQGVQQRRAGSKKPTTKTGSVSFEFMLYVAYPLIVIAELTGAKIVPALLTNLSRGLLE